MTKGAIDEDLFERLCAWRNKMAGLMSRPAYVIATNDTLREIATAKPRTLSELRGIKGIGETRLSKYGKAYLAIVRGEEPSL